MKPTRLRAAQALRTRSFTLSSILLSLHTSMPMLRVKSNWRAATTNQIWTRRLGYQEQRRNWPSWNSACSIYSKMLRFQILCLLSQTSSKTPSTPQRQIGGSLPSTFYLQNYRQTRGSLMIYKAQSMFGSSRYRQLRRCREILTAAVPPKRSNSGFH